MKNDMSRIGPRTAVKLGAVVAVSTLLLAGCTSAGGSSSSSSSGGTVTQAQINKAMSTPSTITFWSWLPDVKNEIALFEKKYPKITVKYENAGQGTPEYTKLRTVIKAGSGQPDVAQVEYQYIPSFQSDLLSLNPYGAQKLAPLFTPSVWKQVQASGQVLGMPQDIGPMGNLYRSDIFKKAGITPPTTWAEYMTAAKELKDKTGDFISDLPGNDAGQFVSLMWQAGSRPFGFDGKKTVTIDLQNAADKKVVDYWNTMLQDGLVDNQPDFNNDWDSSLASGKYAGWLVAAWGPDNLTGAVAKTSGLWTAAPLPQFSSTASPVSSFWGGSSDAVLKSSKNPIVAYEFAKFLNTDPASTILESTSSQELYPSTVATLNDPKFVNEKNAFFGGQQVNKLFGDITKTVDSNFQWLPFMDFVYTTYNTTLGAAIANKTSLEAGLAAWQSQVVAYAKQQGYTVKTN
jgi:multiple sugar transport system substrate-binding protein